MTIKEVKEVIKKLKRQSVICFIKEPIKLPEKIYMDDKEYLTSELEQSNNGIKDGYLLKGTQCLVIDHPSLEDNEIEISFFFCTYCSIKSDDDIFDLWDFHVQELDNL